MESECNQYIYKAQALVGKQNFFRYNKFLATNFTGYAKMISLWGFFRFYANGEHFCKEVTRDDIYNRIIEFKAKNEIIKNEQELQ